MVLGIVEVIWNLYIYIYFRFLYMQIIVFRLWKGKKKHDILLDVGCPVLFGVANIGISIHAQFV